MKLRTKLAVGLIAVTLVLSLATYGGLELYKQQQIDAAQADADETAGLAAEQIDAELHRQRNGIDFLSQKLDGDLENTDRVLDRVDTNGEYFAGLVTNGTGYIVAVRGPYDESMRQELVGSRSTADCVNWTLESGDNCIGTPERVGDGYVVVFSSAVFDSTGEIAGVLSIAVRVNSLTFFSGLEPLATSEQTVAVTNDGEALRPAESDFDQPIVGVAEVESTGWLVRVERDRAPLNAQLQRLAIAQALGIFLVMGLVVLAGYWEYTVNLRQTDRLLTGFDAIERGEYDHELSLTAGEEWAQISSGFNELTGVLADREEALREREQRLGVLNRVLRHNVRNEMNVILSYAQMLRERVGEEELADMAGTVVGAGQRLVDLGEKARSVEETLGGRAEPEVVNLAALAREGTAGVAEEYPAVELRTELPDACEVLGTPALVDAVEELVENGCSHNDADDPFVAVELDCRDDGATLRVADNGPGIPEHERGAIEKGQETALEHSSGLGLWMVYWIADRCEATLSFAEREPRGAVVELTFTAPPDEE